MAPGGSYHGAITAALQRPHLADQRAGSCHLIRARAVRIPAKRRTVSSSRPVGPSPFRG